MNVPVSRLAYNAQGKTGLEFDIPLFSSGSFTGVSCFAIAINTSPFGAIALNVSSSSAQITGFSFQVAAGTP